MGAKAPFFMVKIAQSKKNANLIKQPQVGQNNCSGFLLSELISLMTSVKADAPEAKLNATSISDGAGGRILL